MMSIRVIQYHSTQINMFEYLHNFLLIFMHRQVFIDDIESHLLDCVFFQQLQVPDHLQKHLLVIVPHGVRFFQNERLAIIFGFPTAQHRRICLLDSLQSYNLLVLTLDHFQQRLDPLFRILDVGDICL